MRFSGIATILATALLAACSSGSGAAASAYAKKLVGHWSSAGNDNLYFGEADQTSKIGSYILVHPDGKAFTHQYKIESVEPRKRTIKTNLLFAGGDQREQSFLVSDDAQSVETTTLITGIETHSQLSKVDDKTAP